MICSGRSDKRAKTLNGSSGSYHADTTSGADDEMTRETNWYGMSLGAIGFTHTGHEGRQRVWAKWGRNEC